MAALVLISGGPASGKTATAQAVAAALIDAGMRVVVVREEGDPATLYAGECLTIEIRVFFFLFFFFRLSTDSLISTWKKNSQLDNVPQTRPRRSRPAAPSARASTAP